MKIKNWFLTFVWLVAVKGQASPQKVEVHSNLTDKPLKALIDEDGQALLTQMPNQVSIDLIPSSALGAIFGLSKLEDKCTTIAQLSRSYKTLQHKSLRDMIRENLQIAFELDSPFILKQSDLENSLRASSDYLGHAPVNLINPIKWNNVEVSMSFKSDAISPNVGEFDDLEKQIKTAMTEALLTKNMDVTIGAADLACDILHKRVTIKVKANGQQDILKDSGSGLEGLVALNQYSLNAEDMFYKASTNPKIDIKDSNLFILGYLYAKGTSEGTIPHVHPNLISPNAELLLDTNGAFQDLSLSRFHDQTENKPVTLSFSYDAKELKP